MTAKEKAGAKKGAETFFLRMGIPWRENERIIIYPIYYSLI
jgi:N-dimethylarginine dimethylaminohydrolase